SGHDAGVYELRANPAARAALWQQICEHEHDFYPLQLEGAQVTTPAFMNSGQTRRHAPHYGNKSANMNTISI
ncbi:hypothetical protein VS875_22205, partial [Salmonella enterica subsp. enterica serovar Paratyphi A]|nr:hypothetical protein [Salmonella enterica subsp. enterica serovar Paratyphi A]